MEGKVDHSALLRIGRELLVALGEDPEREGLQDTPQRWANWWREFNEYDPGMLNRCFTHLETDQMVCVSGLRVWSLCEHHLLPFWCDVAVGYIPRGRVLGLSKIARLVQGVAHRLQIQEGLVQQIADQMEEISGSRNVAVVGKGEHLCMTMRGVRTPGTFITSVVRGVFREKAEARAEFLRLIEKT